MGHCLLLPGRGYLQKKYVHLDVLGRATAKSSKGLISKYKTSLSFPRLNQPIERKRLIAMLIFLSTSFLLLGNSARSQEDCNVFQEGKCHLTTSCS